MHVLDTSCFSSGRSSSQSGVAVLQPKGRSFSTTAIPSSALCRRGVRERKTVCSLHPLTLGAPPGSSSLADPEEEEAADDRDGLAAMPLPPPPLPSVRRLHTSDYDSSNDSPSGSDTNDPCATSAPPALGQSIHSRLFRSLVSYSWSPYSVKLGFIGVFFFLFVLVFAKARGTCRQTRVNYVSVK